MKNNMLTAVLAGLLVISVASAWDDEPTLAEVNGRVNLLCEMVTEMQSIVAEVMERFDGQQKLVQDLVTLMQNDKEFYNKNKVKLDYVIQSCDEMEKKNGETLYRCKIKFNDAEVIER